MISKLIMSVKLEPTYDDDDDSDDRPPPKRAAPAPAPAPKRRARGDDEAEEGEEEDELPMPHNGSMVAVAVDPVVKVFNPMWRELFDDLGEQPVPRSRCWGCRRGMLSIRGLPWEGYTFLTSQLHDKVVEHGLYATALWAGEYYHVNVWSRMVADNSEREQSRWNNASIIWHFFKHTHIAQLRLLGEQIELEYASDLIITKKLFVRPQFSLRDDDFNVDAVELKALAPIRGMLDKIRKTDPKKTSTYHQALGTSAHGVRVLKDRYTGEGVLLK